MYLLGPDTTYPMCWVSDSGLIFLSLDYVYCVPAFVAPELRAGNGIEETEVVVTAPVHTPPTSSS